MTIIDNLTAASDQTTVLVLPDNSTATLRLRFKPRTQRWVADVAYANTGFQLFGLNVCTFPNVLRPWRNVLPFGLAFVTSDGTDPFNVNDFASFGDQPARVTVYLLDAADVAAVEAQVIGPRPVVGDP
jgi:hypothetical protein